MKRRHFQRAALATVLGLGVPWAQALSRPDSRPLRLVVPFPPGGATDITARLMAEPLSRLLEQPVIVDNRPGAGGSIGMAEVARAVPDGLTLGVATLSTHGVNPAVYKKLPYDPIKDFVAVTELVKAPGVLVVHPSVKARTVQELVALLKAAPGRLMFASPGNGTIGHMWGELFKSTTRTDMVHVPYRGAGPALNDLLGGQVQVYFDQVASSLPHIKSGRLRALAVSWATRLDFLPEVPTYAEATLYANNDPSWFGLVAPVGTPAGTVQRLQEAVARAVREGELVRRLADDGLFPSASRSEDFALEIRRDIDKMGRVAQLAHITLD